MDVLLVNAEAPEKKDWFSFPLGVPNISYANLQLLQKLAHVRETDRAAPLLVKGIDSTVDDLQCFIPENATPEQLNALAIKIDYMQPIETIYFEAALKINKVNKMEDILRIADKLDRCEMFIDVHSLSDLGRVLVQTGIVDIPEKERPGLDYDKIGAEFQDKHGGIFMGYSYITMGGI